ncbi:MAG: hypothetical protein ACRDKF_11080 [Actinomycetota bacterium]
MRSRIALVALVAVAATAVPIVSAAVPAKSSFGPAIDASPSYEGQRKCSPYAKPGVLAFQRMVLAAYPGTGYGSIARGCDVGGTSEHKEGRAWDWGVNAANRSQKAAAESLFEWLFARDSYGNRYAMVRRLGVMYVIFNRRIWFPGSGWRVYCEQRKRGCVSPSNGSVLHPHTDHVHFSFTWDGAMKRTTFWKVPRSMITGIAGHPTTTGGWLAGGNGSVFAVGSVHGSESAWLKRPVVDIAATPSGGGYWLLRSDGKVMAFGDAVHRGGLRGGRARVGGMSATPNGKGYWIVTRSGRVHAFGNAINRGGARKKDATITALVSTPTGGGYWLLATDGRVFAYGDAVHMGEAKRGTAFVGGDNKGADGYWLVTRGGNVRSFGSAANVGDLSGNKPSSPVIDMAATPSGKGYVLVTAKGKVFRFGDARR